MSNHTLRGVATAGLLGILGACAPMTPQERRVADEKLLGLALGVGGRARANPGVAWAGDAIVSSTNAEQGRTQVIVNDYVPPAPTPGRVEAVIVDKNTGKSYTLTGRSDESVADAMRRSPEFQREGRGYEFKRKQIINSGRVILYEPLSDSNPEDPFNEAQVFSGERDIAVGFLVGSPYFEDERYSQVYVNIDNLQSGKTVELGEKNSQTLTGVTTFSGGMWAGKGEFYYETRFNPKSLQARTGEGTDFRVRVYILKEGDEIVRDKITPFGSDEFIIRNR